MTPRQRLLAVLHGERPDSVPVCPDVSNMIPARLTGRPFWDVYLYQDPPLWKAHLDTIKQLGFDGGFELYDFGDLFGDLPDRQTRIVKTFDDGRIVTQDYFPQTARWDDYVRVHTADNPPAWFVKPESMGLSPKPEQWRPVEDVKQWPTGLELWNHIRRELGEQGVLGMPSGFRTCLLQTEDDVYRFYETPDVYARKVEEMVACAAKRLDRIAQLPVKPDFLFCGASGSLVLQSPQIFRDLILPGLKEVTRRAKQLNIPTHVHSCGPEKELVKMAVEETDLTVIDPLEMPPMGDCLLGEIKRQFGSKIVLKGNLHTTDVMLHGSPRQVADAAKRAIDAAADGGGFILSTGDQCGRDTPLENIAAMIETARTYGKY